MSNYLIHYGILGQKWGHRNGPPYPLSSSKMSESEKKAKNSTTKKQNYSVSKAQLKREIDNMTNAELRRAIDRINMQTTVDDMDTNIVRAGFNKAMKDIQNMTQAMNTINNFANAFKVFVKLAGWL